MLAGLAFVLEKPAGHPREILVLCEEIRNIVDVVVLRPLPLGAPGRLVSLWEENPEKGWHQQVVAPANMLDWREQVPSFQDVTAYQEWGRATLTGDGGPQLLRVSRVMGNFFAVLGAGPGGFKGKGEAPGPIGSVVGDVSPIDMGALTRIYNGSEPA